jgi:hypothetical protein
MRAPSALALMMLVLAAAPAAAASAPTTAPAAKAAATPAQAQATQAPQPAAKVAAALPSPAPATVVSASVSAPAAPAAPSASLPAAAATPAAPPAAVRPLPPATSTTAAATARTGAIREPAPRPTTDVRVQSRFAVKVKTAQLFAAAQYLSRGDFYNSPGARVGATYYPFEPLGFELQVSHFWSSLNAEAERVKTTLGALPDSHAPAWLFLAGGRYSIGYGKLMVGGLGGAIHFEPQAFVHGGMHVHDGDVGPSGDFGLGLLVYLTPRMFARIDAAVVYEREDRSGQSVAVWGTLPAIGVGGTL